MQCELGNVSAFVFIMQLSAQEASEPYIREEDGHSWTYDITLYRSYSTDGIV